MIEAAHSEIVVKRRPEAVAEVRGFVRLTLSRWQMDDHVPCLVASELVTNAVRHATADDVTVRLSQAGDGALWVEVEDAARAIPCVQDADPAGESGRGLFIVARLARHWGVRPLADGAGKVVFAVIDPRADQGTGASPPARTP